MKSPREPLRVVRSWEGSGYRTTSKGYDCGRATPAELAANRAEREARVEAIAARVAAEQPAVVEEEGLRRQRQTLRLFGRFEVSVRPFKDGWYFRVKNFGTHESRRYRGAYETRAAAIRAAARGLAKVMELRQ